MFVRLVCLIASLPLVYFGLTFTPLYNPLAAVTVACLTTIYPPKTIEAVIDTIYRHSPSFGAYRQHCDVMIHTQRLHKEMLDADSWFFRAWSNTLLDEASIVVPYPCVALDWAGLTRDIVTMLDGGVLYMRLWVSVIGAISYLVPKLLLIGGLFTIGTTLALVGMGYWCLSKRLVGVKSFAQLPPFRPRDIRARFQAASGRWRFPKSEPSDHSTLATERKLVEHWMLTTAFGVASKVRDIGGSLRRNASFGKALHICFPNIDSLDHNRLQLNRDCPNDVGEHTLGECKCKASFSILSYSDFHINIDELSGIKHPCFIATHDFANMSGEFTWNDGEATGWVGQGFVNMTTRGGSTYAHSFHDWKQEGTIVGVNGVLNYSQIGKFGNTIVIYAYPASGDYCQGDPTALRDIVQDKYQLSSSESAHLRSVQLPGTEEKPSKGVSKRYIFCRGEVEIGSMLASTIERTVVAMYAAKRDGVYASNLSGYLRGRITTDRESFDCWEQALQLVQIRCDEVALNVGHKFLRLPESVIGMSFLERIKYRVLVYAYQHLPRVFRGLSLAICAMIIGKSKDSSMVPFLWKEIDCPNYEVNTDLNSSGSGEPRDTKNRTPFRPEGEDSRPHPTGQQQRSAPRRTGKCEGVNGDKGSEQQSVPSSTSGVGSSIKSLPSITGNNTDGTPTPTTSGQPTVHNGPMAKRTRPLKQRREGKAHAQTTQPKGARFVQPPRSTSSGEGEKAPPKQVPTDAGKDPVLKPRGGMDEGSATAELRNVAVPLPYEQATTAQGGATESVREGSDYVGFPNKLFH